MSKALSLLFIASLLLVGCTSDDSTSTVDGKDSQGVVLNGGESSSGGGSTLTVTPEIVQAYIESIRTAFGERDSFDPKLRLLFYRPYQRVYDFQSKESSSLFLQQKFSTPIVTDPQSVFFSFYKNITGSQELFVGSTSLDIYQQISIEKLRGDLEKIKWVYDDCAKLHNLPNHKHASFYKNGNEAVLCFDPKKLSDLSPDTFKNQIMTLFLHEIGHFYGFSEDECVVLQKIFFWNFEAEKASSIHQVRLFDLINKLEVNADKWCSSQDFVQTLSDANVLHFYLNLVGYPLSVEATVEKGTNLEKQVVFLLDVFESAFTDADGFKSHLCGVDKNKEFNKINFHLNLLRAYLLGDAE